MHSRIAEALGLKQSPVAILLTNTRPENATQFKEGRRGKIDKELLCFTMPVRMFQEMEACVDNSFLSTTAWQKLRDRW